MTAEQKKAITSKSGKYVYVILSSTPYKLSAFIRKVTGFHYNHVSLCMDMNTDKKMFPMYSYARYYKNAPLYAGFVKESIRRYKHMGKYSDFIIFAIPVEKKKYDAMKKYLETLDNAPGGYLYNMLSAACNPFHKKVIIKDSYTCIEFAIEILTRFKITDKLDPKKFYSIKDIYDIFRKYTVYKGSSEPFFKHSSVGNDTFFVKKSRLDITLLTVKSNVRLVVKYVKQVLR